MANENLENIGAQIGALARAVGILTSSLHAAGVIDGRAVAASIRLDKSKFQSANILSEELADLIGRTITKYETEGYSGLSEVT
jgi:hypothetical protein